MVNGVSTHWISEMGRVVKAGATGDDGSDSRACDECAEIPCRVAGFNVAIGICDLTYVGHVVHGGAGRDRINYLRDGSGSCPRPLRRGGHEPNSLQAQVISVTNLNYFIRSIISILTL